MITIEGDEKLKNQSELAVRLGVSVDFIKAMVRDGFKMPGAKAFVDDASKWLSLHPDFRVTKPLPDEQRLSLEASDK